MPINRLIKAFLFLIGTCVFLVGQTAPPRNLGILGTHPASSSNRYFDQSKVATLSVPNSTNGTTYYIDGTNGSDRYNGLYPTHTTGSDGPFKTISNALGRYSGRVHGGNVFKIRAGTYRESIEIGSAGGSGTDATHRVVIGPYGDGEVILDPTPTHLLTWTAHDTNIYKADWSVADNSNNPPCAIIMDDNFKLNRPVYNLSDVTSFGRWYYDRTTHFVYVYTGGTSPIAHNVYTVKFDENNGSFAINVLSDYATIYGMTIIGASSLAVYTSCNYVTMEYCTVKFSGKSSFISYGSYPQVLKCHIWGNVLMNWPRGHRYGYQGGWPGATTWTKDNGLASGNIVHDNGGEGISVGGLAVGNAVVEDNIVYNNWSVNIYVQPGGYNTIRRNLVYAATQDVSDIISSDDPTIPSMGDPYGNLYPKFWRRLYPVGIGTAVEGPGTDDWNGNNKIYNNVIVSCWRGIDIDQSYGTMGPHVIANNTIVMPTIAPPTNANWGGIAIPGKPNHGSIVKNNIIYCTRSIADSFMVIMPNGTRETNVIFDRNVYYNPNYTTMFAGSGSNTYAFAQWKAAMTLQDQNSVWGNPLFAGGSSSVAAAYYVPSASGSAKGLAATITNFTNDFYSVTRTAPWDAGALISR